MTRNPFGTIFFVLLAISSLWAQQPKEASAVPVLPADIPATAERYSVVVMGNLAGQQAVWTAPDSARIMNLDRELGSIAPGKLADLTLVDGDPVANISDVRKTALVVKDGVVYRPAELYSALGVEP